MHIYYIHMYLHRYNDWETNFQKQTSICQKIAFDRTISFLSKREAISEGCYDIKQKIYTSILQGFINHSYISCY